MAFSQEPIPEIITEETRSKYGDGAPFRHRSVIRDWVEDIFKRNGQQQLVELDTAVERAQRSDSGWTLTLRKAPAGTSTESWWQETFDSVVVATGHYHVPSVPNIPGLAAYDDNFPGRIRHTKHFQTANEFSGKVGLAADKTDVS